MMLKSFTLSACLVAGMAVAPVLSLAATASGTSVLDNLEDLRAVAAGASASASDLASLSHSENTTFESHAYQWNALKESVNTMGRKLTELESQRDSATPAERTAIDRAEPLLKQMAETTTAAMKFINNDQEGLWRPAYQKYVEQIGETSSQLSGTLGQMIHLEDLRAKTHHIEKTTGVENVD